MNTKTLFLHLLLTANFKATRFKGYTLKPGQLITTMAQLARETGLSAQEVRTAIKHLISTNEITSKSTNKFTLITLENWGKYQSTDTETNKQPNKPSNKPSTSIEEQREKIYLSRDIYKQQQQDFRAALRASGMLSLFNEQQLYVFWMESGGNAEKVREKFELSKMARVKNLTAWIIEAIRNDYKPQTWLNTIEKQSD